MSRTSSRPTLPMICLIKEMSLVPPAVIPCEEPWVNPCPLHQTCQSMALARCKNGAPAGDSAHAKRARHTASGVCTLSVTCDVCRERMTCALKTEDAPHTTAASGRNYRVAHVSRVMFRGRLSPITHGRWPFWAALLVRDDHSCCIPHSANRLTNT